MSPPVIAVGVLVVVTIAAVGVAVVFYGRGKRAVSELDSTRQQVRFHAEREHELMEHSSRLGVALDSLPVGMLLCDRAGDIVLQNGAALDALGVGGRRATIDSAISEMVSDLLERPTDGDTLDPIERMVDFFGPPAGVLRLSATLLVDQSEEPEDQRRPDDVSSAPFACVVIEDVTARHRSERVRRDFVANISHELRTPVGAIGLIAETIHDELAADNFDLVAVRRLAGRATVEVERVSRTIDDLLELSHIEFDDQSQAEHLTISAVVDEAIGRASNAADARTISFDVSIPAALAVIGDRRQLVSALFNLLDNALKYSPPSSVVRVVAELDEASSNVRVSVTDRGIGIPSRDLDRIFERFYRADRARSRETGGTGLGLAIVRHVVANHGGSVGVSSREGDGSTFTLELPLSVPSGETDKAIRGVGPKLGQRTGSEEVVVP